MSCLRALSAFVVATCWAALMASEHTAGDDWFPFEPRNDSRPGGIGMADWLDAPAGKHGWLHLKDDGFAFANGQTIRFWGVNNGSGGCAPSHEEATARASWYAKYGVNAVRQHKFTNPCSEAEHSTRLREEAWDRLDFYHGELRKRGIYYGWSHIYHHNIKSGDGVDWARELGNDSYGAVNFVPALQDLHIQLTVGMLEHENPYTGLRYADDPALNFIELQNEDDIFFGSGYGAIKRSPTAKRIACASFSDWLQAKYGSQAALEQAWGEGSFNVEPDCPPDEKLESRNILPITHPWWHSADGRSKKSYHQRLNDTARWAYETQNAFYDRFIAAIRKTGYQGPIVGSCWQAGEGYTHFYNLHSDFRAGIIDRHNYAGGGEHRLNTRATIRNDSMLSQPGGFILGTGMQQVAGRPFALSEWIHKPPVEWTAEGPALIATYGLGLQGWDASYHFASKGGYGKRGEHGFSLKKSRATDGALSLSNPHVYNADLPSQIGQYPVLARMLYRGDITEAEALPTRKVHLSSLAEGKVGFSEKVEQAGDIKAFSGLVPNAALAVGKVQVEFTETFEQSTAPQLDEYIDEHVVRSSTGELSWHTPREGEGFVCVDTAATKGVFGFASGRSHVLGDVRFTIETPFAVCWLTSLERDKDLGNCDRALLYVIARHYNTGMAFNADRTRLSQVGKAPLLMEPVDARVELPRPIKAVRILDADGMPTERSASFDANGITVDGSSDKTIYYLIEF